MINAKPMKSRFEDHTEVIILATGYAYTIPTFLDGVRSVINWNEAGKYAVNEDYSIDGDHSIFVQNGEQHTHGFNSAYLELGPYRNAVIINAILKKEKFFVESKNTFQQF